MSYTDYIPGDVLELCEVHDSKHAAAILANEFPEQFADICEALKGFKFSETEIKKAGGNKSEILKKLSQLLRPRGWAESHLKAQLIVDDRPLNVKTHKVDYIKGRVVFDLEWNSKDQTVYRAIYAIKAFYEYNKISLGIIVTRSLQLNRIIKRLEIMNQYDANKMLIRKLEPRLNLNAVGYPVLVFGMKPNYC